MRAIVFSAACFAAIHSQLNAATTKSISFWAYDSAAQNTPYYSHFSVTSDSVLPGWYGSGDGISQVVGIVNLYDSGWGYSETGNSSYHVMTRIDTSANSPRVLRAIGWHHYEFSWNTLTNQMEILMDGNVIQSGAYAQPINWFMFDFNGHTQETVMDDFKIKYDGVTVYDQGFESASLDAGWIVNRVESGGYATSGDISNPHSGNGALALGANVSGIVFDLNSVPEPSTVALISLFSVGLIGRRKRVSQIAH